MRIGVFSGRAARSAARRVGQAAGAALLAAGLLAGCAAGRQQAAIPPRDALPLDQATASLAVATILRAELAPGRRKLAIDPLIDRATGAQTAATRSMETQIAALIRDRHPELELVPFTAANLEEKPLILLGAITTVTGAGSLANAQANGRPPTYRIWAVLADLNTGRVLSHETAWVQPEGVDATPAAFFRDSPAWTNDGAVAAYLRTCALNPGDPIDPAYLSAIRAQALVADGIRAHEARRYADALAFHVQARQAAPEDQQLRARNGVYLANWALGRRAAAEAAFGDLVDYGLTRNRLAVKFVFRPGSTAFWPDAVLTRPYPMWLRQIATRTSTRSACLKVEGHTSITGSAPMNDRLSQRRADTIRGRLLRQRPELQPRLVAEGLGSREALVGTGRDDASDLLDRRVEFEPLACPAAPEERAAASP